MVVLITVAEFFLNSKRGICYLWFPAANPKNHDKNENNCCADTYLNGVNDLIGSTRKIIALYSSKLPPFIIWNSCSRRQLLWALHRTKDLGVVLVTFIARNVKEGGALVILGRIWDRSAKFVELIYFRIASVHWRKGNLIPIQQKLIFNNYVKNVNN